MATLHELIAQRKEILDAMKETLDTCEQRKRMMTKEEREVYEKNDREVDRINELIRGLQKIDNNNIGKDMIINPFPGYTNARSTDNGGFENIGELFNAVYRFRKEGVRDDRLEALRPDTRQQSMGTGSEGGFALPEQFRPEIWQAATQQGIVRPRATVIPAGDPPDAKLIMPALDQTGAQNNFGGITFTHSGENVTLVETDMALRQVTMEPKKIAGYIVTSNELLNNWSASSAVISGMMAKAMAAQEDYDFMRGSGINQSIGFINSPAAIGYNRAGANGVTFADVYGMLARAKMGNPLVWLASQTIIPQLAGMTDAGSHAVWTGSRADNLTGAAQAMPSTLFGFPLFFCDRLPALGTKGDLNLVDLSYYLIKDGSAMRVDLATELLFLTDRSIFRITWRVDGKPWLTEPLTLEGDSSQTVSPFVILDTP